jgi:UDP-N-acetylmuramyl pentapeptide phosphotransferase/UDP-N-acetylglucosamine-1-phosphate transferase
MHGIFWIILGTLGITVCSYFLSKYNILIAKKLGLIDHPDSDRKLHDSLIPLAGINFSILLALGLSTVIFYWQELGFGDYFELTKNPENVVNWWWIVAGILVILIGGFLDDKYRLKAWQLAIPINIALLMIVLGGNLQIESFSYPFNTILPDVAILHYFLAWLWLGLCLATTKFLDGHDGLVTSVGVVNLSVIAAVALLPNINQPLVWGICLVWIACLAGFMPFNLPKARSYIGEAGSEIVGLMIGVLSILSIRIRSGKSPLAAGREHWHFRLLDYGFSRWQVLGISLGLITFTGIFGAFLPTVYKPFIILFEAVVLGVIFGITSGKLNK